MNNPNPQARTLDMRRGASDSPMHSASVAGSFPPAVTAFLDHVVRLQVVTATELDQLLETQRELKSLDKPEDVGNTLVKHGLLTQYQLDRILTGATYGLTIGNYRIRDRLGSGSMGIVFKAEHIFMRRLVALKVVPMDDDCHPSCLSRFYAEIQVQAELHHPNIVMAYDAGKHMPQTAGYPTLLYLAMELVDGCDLEHYLDEHGPVPVGLACDWIRQAAGGLQQAHDRHLIHRDIKPSNMLLASQGFVKLSDFGLVRQFSNQMTDPNALLGTVQFMAPEQSVDPTNVSSAADIFALGASLFWLLTGEPPYAQGNKLSESLRNLRQTSARPVRQFCPAAPKELEDVLHRLLHRDPTRRPPLARAVMKALEPFAQPQSKP